VPDRPEIVCICGSTRFVDEMRAANRDLTFAGVIVVAPGEADDSPMTNSMCQAHRCFRPSAATPAGAASA
jgi:hypothetical protein